MAKVNLTLERVKDQEEMKNLVWGEKRERLNITELLSKHKHAPLVGLEKLRNGEPEYSSVYEGLVVNS